MKRIIHRRDIGGALLLVMLIAASTVTAQTYYRLTPSTWQRSLSLDLDKVFNYNRYEGYRLGLGLLYSGPLTKDSGSPVLETEVYGAYGSQDQRFKFGGEVGLQLKNKLSTKFYIEGIHDIEEAASHKLGSYILTDVANNSSYLSWHYSQVRRLTLGMSGTYHAFWNFDIEARASKESYLFNNGGMIYPSLDDIDMPTMNYQEVKVDLSYRKELKAQLMLGRMTSSFENITLDGHYCYTEVQALYARLLMQYSHTYQIAKNYNVDLFAQAGLSSRNIPYSRMFDMGGAGGYHYFFRNTLLTVLPSEFVCNDFAYANVILYRSKPFWNLSFSKPVPFVQLSYVIGNAWGSNGTYYSYLANQFCDVNDRTSPNDLNLLQQPTMGLLEPAFGINRLFQYQYINLSGAVAYRIVPGNAPYRRTDAAGNWSFMLGATLNL